ncbi:hypothetical protein T03_5059, partial [Trichinella britovi]
LRQTPNRGNKSPCICSIQLCSGQLNFTNESLALSQAYQG